MANFHRKLAKYMKVALIIFQIPFLCIAFLVLQILKRIAPGLMYKIVTQNMLSKIEFNQWKNSEKVQTVDDLNFIFSTEIFKWKVLSGIEDAMKDAVLGAPAPDVPILNVSSKKTINLLSLSSSGRPLVLNFGSCS